MGVSFSFSFSFSFFLIFVFFPLPFFAPTKKFLFGNHYCYTITFPPPFPSIDQISVACFDATPFVAFFLFSPKYIKVPLSVPVTRFKKKKETFSSIARLFGRRMGKDCSIVHSTCLDDKF